MSVPTCIDCGVTVRPDNLGTISASPFASAAMCAACFSRYPHVVAVDIRIDEAMAAQRAASPAPVIGGEESER
jgi:hypothetical protein